MPHATATLNGKVIADADKWETVEGNIYVSKIYGESLIKLILTYTQFPPSSIDQSTLSKAKRTAVCPWKGKASYYNITVDGMSLASPSL